MKRLMLCTAMTFLTLAAIQSRPAGACPINPTCEQSQCFSSCIAKGAETGSCTGVCHACQCLF